MAPLLIRYLVIGFEAVLVQCAQVTTWELRMQRCSDSTHYMVITERMIARICAIRFVGWLRKKLIGCCLAMNGQLSTTSMLFHLEVP